MKGEGLGRGILWIFMFIEMDGKKIHPWISKNPFPETECQWLPQKQWLICLLFSDSNIKVQSLYLQLNTLQM